MSDDSPRLEGMPSTLPQVMNAPTRPLDAEAMRRRIGARLFGGSEEPLQLGRFRVLRSLGVGGMGVVYAAEDDTLGRIVAIKMIRDDVIASGDDRRRILLEARALARLSHPNVVQLHEVVASDDAVFIVMEYVAGVTLLQWLRAETRDVAAILAVFAAVGRGLAVAHRAGIVHRDVKPSNILIGDDGRVRIVDFGLARGVAPGSAAGISGGPPTPIEPATPRTGAASEATNASAVAGTPAYMAPEAFLGGVVDTRGDQFSFCVALHESLYGYRPFGGEGMPGVERLRRPLTLPSASEFHRIPRSLRRLLARGLASRPEDRFATMDELVAALESGPARRRRWIFGAMATALAGGALIAGWISADAAPTLCPAATAQLAGVWDEEVREAVHGAILATGQSFSGRTAALVDEPLDRYAAQWLAAHRDACEATWVRGEQSEASLDRSMRCLARRRGALAALTAQLRGADTQLVISTPELVFNLPEIAACRDAEALADHAMDAPGDPRSTAANHRIARAAALHKIGAGTEALELVDAGLAEARAIGDGRLEAEALRVRGRLRARELGDLPGGLADLHAAIDRAAASGRDLLSWRIWNDLAELAARTQQDVEEARRLLAHARGAAARHGPPAAVDEAELLDTEGFILWLEERLEDALARHQQALALRVQDLAPEHPDLLWSRLRVANATADLGRADEALQRYAGLRRDVRASYGDDHPVTLRVELPEAQLLAELGRHGEARARLEHARPPMLRIYGPQTPLLAIVDLELARLDLAEGQREAGLARAQGVLELPESALPGRHHLRVEALELLARLYFEGDDFAGAVDVYRRLLVLHDEHGQELDLEALLYNLGDALCTLKRCAEGLDYFTRLLDVVTRQVPQIPVRRALPLYGLGYAHFEAGRPDLALLPLEEAYRLVRAEPDALPHVDVDVARLLARCLEALRREPRLVRSLRKEADARAKALAKR